MSDAKWSSGTSYGPVLTQTDLYLLDPKVEIHPIFRNAMKSFHLNFNLSTGQTGGYNADDPHAELPFVHKDESATLPRMQELYVITRYSPWCTHVKNQRGVTLGDVCVALWREYSDTPLTDAELAALPATLQDRVRRTAAVRERDGGQWPGGQYFAPTPNMGAGPGRLKRIDYLFDRVQFDGLDRDDAMAKARLGFAAPNIFSMTLINY